MSSQFHLGYYTRFLGVVQREGETCIAAVAAEPSCLPILNSTSPVSRSADPFHSNGKESQVTDKGTRVIVAIHVTEAIRMDPPWLIGPPYAAGEIVFDELDFPSVSLVPDD
jgi:hypothetical protein